ncbi:MAG: response regulator [Nitrospirota bacterium]|nr:response regulator [Nitrospirota bacterium]
MSDPTEHTENAVSVLVVDDDSEMTDLLTTVLGDAGYQVTAASGPEEAMDLIRAHPPELVVTDLSMPTASGLDLVQAARDDMPALHFIVLTAFGDWPSFCRAQDLKVDRYLSKPVAMDRLLDEVAAVLATPVPSPSSLNPPKEENPC